MSRSTDLLEKAADQWTTVAVEPESNRNYLIAIPGNPEPRVAHYRGNSWWVTVPGSWQIRPSHWAPLPKVPDPSRRK